MEPKEVKSSTPILETLKVHKVLRERNKHRVCCNKIFYFIAYDDSSFFTQWYDQVCVHVIKNLDNNACNCCLANCK